MVGRAEQVVKPVTMMAVEPLATIGRTAVEHQVVLRVTFSVHQAGVRTAPATFLAAPATFQAVPQVGARTAQATFLPARAVA